MSGFAKNVSKMMSGAAGAQAISILLVPIVARLFNPNDFGIAAVFLSIVTILVVPATLRLDHAVALPKSDIEAVKVVNTSVFSLLMFSVVAFLILGVAYVFFPNETRATSLGVYIYLLPVGVVLLGAVRISTGYAVRMKRFAYIGIADISQTFTVVGLRIILGVIYGSNIFSLIIALLSGYLIKLYVTLKKDFSLIGRFFQWRSIGVHRSTIINYKQFPIYSVPTGLLKAFNDNFPIIILTLLFSSTVVGLYAMAFRLIQLPVIVISEPIRRAYLQRIADASNNGNFVTGDLLKITLVLLLPGVIVVLPLLLYGREMFALLLGDRWSDAGYYAAILSPWFVSMLVQAPASCVYIVFKKQNLLLYAQTTATLALMLLYIVSVEYSFNENVVLLSVSLIGCSINIVTILMAFYISKKSEHIYSD